MRGAIITVAACAALLWAGTVLAAATRQQKCDSARLAAWKSYNSCVDTVVIKIAKGLIFDRTLAFARCRHTYFTKWTAFQTDASLPGSTCQPADGARFVDNGDGTVTDGLTTLVWEKKTNLDSTPNFADPHDADNLYTWSTGSNKEDGTAFTSFLGTVNGGGGFAGANGWRLPTMAELQTIVLDFPCTGFSGTGPTCTCPSNPCVDPALDAANTPQSSFNWSANGWLVVFRETPGAGGGPSTTGAYVRAVRRGW